mmetsp:Transcript_61292/g.136504  ORF Transcript_61292/g.136504 Transcript_61292/m.136504 type:complete len:216 (+) Transcript_61292:462-1109(+)
MLGPAVSRTDAGDHGSGPHLSVGANSRRSMTELAETRSSRPFFGRTMPSWRGESLRGKAATAADSAESAYFAAAAVAARSYSSRQSSQPCSLIVGSDWRRFSIWAADLAPRAFRSVRASALYRSIGSHGSSVVDGDPLARRAALNRVPGFTRNFCSSQITSLLVSTLEHSKPSLEWRTKSVHLRLLLGSTTGQHSARRGLWALDRSEWRAVSSPI